MNVMKLLINTGMAYIYGIRRLFSPVMLFSGHLGK